MGSIKKCNELCFRKQIQFFEISWNYIIYNEICNDWIVNIYTFSCSGDVASETLTSVNET